MKKLIIMCVAIAMVASFSNKVMAQETANANNTALATIIAPITITKGVDLSFGDIIKGVGTVTVATNAARTINDAMKSGLQVGTITAATFTVGGEPLYTYGVTLPDDLTVKIDLATPADPMNVTAFNCVTTKTNATDKTGALNASGTDVITVGATLTVAADQAIGDYSGAFNVIVAYN